METLTRSSGLLLPPLPDLYFTATELAAAEQLVQLSGSGADTSSSSSFSSPSSSPRSVNKRPPLGGFLLEAEEEKEEKEEGTGPWRRTQRYRPVADLYAATEPISSRGGGKQG
ncbi:hypothetical protein MUK42_08913 [Musa troglodytarum]|uniref:Uncharacterized protein n=1 Tax=Musa troglodytarum TaxID=320322 RepID=A0A9E7E8I6_9LILI|nr:hypothetical protein MUK42_08913 [Musa troglodytarum]